MLVHLLGFLILLGSALLVVLGLGVLVFALARGNGRLARRAVVLTGSYAVLYLGCIAGFAWLTPRRVLPLGGELSFCGLDCHLHVSVVGGDTTGDRIAVIVRVRSDARQEPEYPQYLRFRLVGPDGTLTPPENEGRAFGAVLAAGQEYVDSLVFPVPPAARPCTLRVTYPGPIDALLFGPASSGAMGKTTLALGGTAS